MNGSIILDYSELNSRATAHKMLGQKVVCTIGSWDMLHIGHLRYLNRAKSKGDILIVGVDSDRGIKLYKNPLRPVIPQAERMEMLSYQECVDYITLVDDIDEQGRWGFSLIKEVPVDLFVAVAGESYTSAQKRTIKQHTGRLVVLPRQATHTSTTNIVQEIVKGHLLAAVNKLKF